MDTNRVIIGIHGLSNKPRESLLAQWWRDSILEGLRRNEGRTAGPVPFDLVYWRDWNYPNPTPDDEIDESYQPAAGQGLLPRYDDRFWDALRAEASELAGTSLDWTKRHFGFGTEAIDSLLGLKFRDLALYYENETKRAELRSRLATAIRNNAGKRIMLIAHSMGSIVAYDVLRLLGRSEPRPTIHHFVTIGSPLGLPYVKHKIWSENDRVRTPSIVQKWTNLADRRDFVAADTHLSDDYRANSDDVRVRDDLILNGYVNREGRPNYHKSYGYLRTPELSTLIRDFI